MTPFLGVLTLVGGKSCSQVKVRAVRLGIQTKGFLLWDSVITNHHDTVLGRQRASKNHKESALEMHLEWFAKRPVLSVQDSKSTSLLSLICSDFLKQAVSTLRWTRVWWRCKLCCRMEMSMVPGFECNFAKPQMEWMYVGLTDEFDEELNGSMPHKLV